MGKASSNFLITAFGRSGTMFLSRVMDRSQLWTVNHEPGGIENNQISSFKEVPDHILNRFDKEYYGEVNTHLREVFGLLPVRQRGIIFRDPREIILSIANRKGAHQIRQIAGELFYYYWYFENVLAGNNKISRIDFYRMTGDLLYLKEVLNVFGITDVEVTKKDLNTVVNANQSKTIESFDDLPADIRNFVKKIPYRPESRLVRI